MLYVPKKAALRSARLLSFPFHTLFTFRSHRHRALGRRCRYRKCSKQVFRPSSGERKKGDNCEIQLRRRARIVRLLIVLVEAHCYWGFPKRPEGHFKVAQLAPNNWL